MKEKNKTSKPIPKKYQNNNSSSKKDFSNKKKLVEIPPLTNIANEQIDFASNIYKIYSDQKQNNINNESSNKNKEKNKMNQKQNKKNKTNDKKEKSNDKNRFCRLYVRPAQKGFINSCASYCALGICGLRGGRQRAGFS